MNVSAVILSAKPVTRSIPGVEVVNYVSRFTDAQGLLASRLAALARVRTGWFFYLDDDDELPEDYLRVLELCMAAGAPVAYTNEWITSADGTGRLRRSGPYSQDAHVADPTLIHHLAVCRTDAALHAALRIPRGPYAVENLLFFEVAKEGAAWVDEIGYLWHRRSGMSIHPSLLIGQVRSAIWADQNRGLS